jgi:predicted O-linked N-acetylglucosamine transferase (SPINDLY family)
LHAAGLPELVTDSLVDYQALALQLARDRHRTAALNAKLVTNRKTQPLFDTARYTRQLEEKFVAMSEGLRRSSTS